MGDSDKMLWTMGIVASTMYQVGVFVAGLATGNSLAWKLALLTAGLTYLSALVQITFPVQRSSVTGSFGIGTVIGSIICGVVAGIVFLIGAPVAP